MKKDGITIIRESGKIGHTLRACVRIAEDNKNKSCMLSSCHSVLYTAGQF